MVMVNSEHIQVGSRQYTRAEIANGTGISISHISRIFSGNRMPSLDTAHRISRYLGITMDALWSVLREANLTIAA